MKTKVFKKSVKNIFSKIIPYMISVLISVLIFTILSLPVYASEEEQINEDYDITPIEKTVYVSSQSGLNVRSGPDTSYDKIGSLRYGQDITVTGKTADDWYQIQYAGGYGYVSIQYVSDTSPTGAETTITEASASKETVTEPEAEYDTGNFDTDIDTEPESYIEKFSGLMGTPVFIILAVAIFVVIALIVYSVYGLFKKESYDEDDEDNPYEGYSDEDYDYDEYEYEDEDVYEDDDKD